MASRMMIGLMEEETSMLMKMNSVTTNIITKAEEVHQMSRRRWGEKEKGMINLIHMV